MPRPPWFGAEEPRPALFGQSPIPRRPHRFKRFRGLQQQGNGGAASLLPALLLARVDGKSPVEYLTTDAEREQVRRAAIPLLLEPPETLEAVRAAWDRTLAE